MMDGSSEYWEKIARRWRWTQPQLLWRDYCDSACARGLAERARCLFLKILQRFESLENWPTRYITGYFRAILAEKRPMAYEDGASWT